LGYLLGDFLTNSSGHPVGKSKLTKEMKRQQAIHVGGKTFNNESLVPGLPDFSWYNIPKRVKCMYQNGGGGMAGKSTKLP
jgi:hypothetical protein